MYFLKNKDDIHPLFVLLKVFPLNFKFPEKVWPILTEFLLSFEFILTKFELVEGGSLLVSLLEDTSLLVSLFVSLLVLELLL